MRLKLLTMFAMTFATLGAAVFFVQTMDVPVRPQRPLLGKYAASLRTALLVDEKPAAAQPPATAVTIINATPR
jgi:hypothetical protein